MYVREYLQMSESVCIVATLCLGVSADVCKWPHFVLECLQRSVSGRIMSESVCRGL